jgi:hypothetical protein
MHATVRVGVHRPFLTCLLFGKADQVMQEVMPASFYRNNPITTTLNENCNDSTTDSFLVAFIRVVQLVTVPNCLQN